MKFIVLSFILVLELFASVIKSPIVTIDKEQKSITIKIKRVDVGMSGFVVHKLAENHSSILNSVVVKSYDKQTEIATLSYSKFDMLRNSALPDGKWSIEVGDSVVLAFGYTRAFLIAPSEEIYHNITKSAKTIEWIHPDIFATILSFRGHPTPLRSDFNALSVAASVGLIFIYLDQRLFTLDSKSFKILNVSPAPLLQDKIVLPFYTRVEEIDAAWWGEGSDEMLDYEPHYYELLVQANPKNEHLKNIIQKGDKKLHFLLKDFTIGDEI